MDLNSIETILTPSSRSEIPELTERDAFLAGGTWLFSEPQPALNRLIDLTIMSWAPLTLTATHLQVSATCKIAELAAFEPPPDWLAGPLILKCCLALLGSFKIWNIATVGGNLCLGLPAGPMTALAVALRATCIIWRPDGTDYTMPAGQFVIGPQQNALGPGEILRRIDIPLTSLRQRFSFRQISLTPQGRSAVLVIGTVTEQDQLILTITAATRHPRQINVSHWPDENALIDRLNTEIPDHLYYDDVHGKPAWRKHMTYVFVKSIGAELRNP